MTTAQSLCSKVPLRTKNCNSLYLLKKAGGSQLQCVVSHVGLTNFELSTQGENPAFFSAEEG